MRTTIPQSPDRPLTPPVQTITCPLCSASIGATCGLTGCHLARWLRAFALCLITREQLVEAIRGLIVITAAQLVEEGDAA
jgi:hypothetical protein